MKDFNIITNEDLNCKMVIYRLVFPNGKMYIGQTINSLKHRLNGHIQSTLNDVKTPIYNAIRKYKTFIVYIECFGVNIEELNTLEIYYINKYNTIVDNGFGYNAEFGGNNKQPSNLTRIKMSENRYGKTLTKETKLKISKTHKGLIHQPISNETKNKMSKAHIGLKYSNERKIKISINTSGENNPFYGKKHSKETKEKMSLAKQNISEETKNKISIAKKGKKKKSMTDEQKMKISSKIKEWWNIRKNKKN